MTDTEYLKLLTLEVKANNRAQTFASESGNNRGSISNRAHDIAHDLLVEAELDPRFYEIKVRFAGGIAGDRVRPIVKIHKKDVVTTLGEVS